MLDEQTCVLVGCANDVVMVVVIVTFLLTLYFLKSWVTLICLSNTDGNLFTLNITK